MSLTTHQVTFNANSCTAGALWIIGLVLTLCDWIGWLTDGAGLVGVIAAAAGHLLCMHGLFACQEARERAAFEMGRETVRSLR